jgi:hypothetical protein
MPIEIGDDLRSPGVAAADTDRRSVRTAGGAGEVLPEFLDRGMGVAPLVDDGLDLVVASLWITAGCDAASGPDRPTEATGEFP